MILPSPKIINSALACFNSCSGAESSIPADALKETVLPSSFMRNTLAACVPTPRLNFSPATESGVLHVD